tara:strand:+ start:473 stop:1096 length:624 start_codon:yes stop_codon:yes gene_type:complete
MPTADVTPANLKKALNAIDPSLVDHIRNVGGDAPTGAVDARELALVANAVRERRSASTNAENEARDDENVARALSYVILTAITSHITLEKAMGKRAKTNADRAARDATAPQWKDLKPHIVASFAARTALRIHTQPVGDANACGRCDGAASLQTQRQQIYMTVRRDASIEVPRFRLTVLAFTRRTTAVWCASCASREATRTLALSAKR